MHCIIEILILYFALKVKSKHTGSSYIFDTLRQNYYLNLSFFAVFQQSSRERQKEIKAVTVINAMSA